MACFGAVSLSTGKFVSSFCEVFNAVTFEAFIKLLLRRRTKGKRLMIVLDNARLQQVPFPHKSEEGRFCFWLGFFSRPRSFQPVVFGQIFFIGYTRTKEITPTVFAVINQLFNVLSIGKI